MNVVVVGVKVYGRLVKSFSFFIAWGLRVGFFGGEGYRVFLF